MPGDLSLHVVHASITYLDGVCVANFVKRVSSWEGLFNDGQKLFSYVGLDILAEGWVKPCNFSIPIFWSGGLVSGIGVKLKFVVILTSLQSSLVRWNGCGKHFFIGRNFGEPILNIFG